MPQEYYTVEPERKYRKINLQIEAGMEENDHHLFGKRPKMSRKDCLLKHIEHIHLEIQKLEDENLEDVHINLRLIDTFDGEEDQQFFETDILFTE